MCLENICRVRSGNVYRLREPLASWAAAFRKSIFFGYQKRLLRETRGEFTSHGVDFEAFGQISQRADLKKILQKDFDDSLSRNEKPFLLELSFRDVKVAILYYQERLFDRFQKACCLRTITQSVFEFQIQKIRLLLGTYLLAQN